MNRDQAKVAIQKLIERFAEHRKAYHAADYNEAKTRQDFINPFFKALGWDVDNENGMSEAYREVIYEDKVVVKGKAKAPDYGFRLMGQGKKRLFYVEAKKPSVALKANKEAAYQLRRYGSSAQAPISILTNFEDFFVYDCSKVPNLSDSATVSRLKHIHFEDYVKEFDFIYDTFSHEAVTKGRFDKFVQSDANKKGSQTLDKEFVQSLDTWRKYLATSIAVNNKKINDEDLNFCVQLIIDRLIFLRFCEDRSVEPYGQLQSAASKGNAYNNLFELFEQADSKYNSGLFDFEKDKLTATLKIDNKVVKNIVEDLYYPQCRYEFSVMPVEVLGNAYEQFLGKVIRITPARGVKIEEKPEVRKAGGVFYTPQYIVDYIVKNTVGKLIDGKAPKEIDKIKVVDPACGSGSFLVGAFEYLLHYHSDWYHHNLSDKEKKKGDILTPDGKLTTHEKKRILTNNIFGVDIDANAVEVSKLSLLLKCMEGETEASIKQQVTMFHERILPDLDNNLKDGNSLIDVDFYDEQIDLGYEKKIKPFSWKKSFTGVFKQGGFDTIIGNPPYIKIQLLREYNSEAVEYYNQKFRSAGKGNYDIYILFLEQAFNLLNEKGICGYILPHKFFNAEYGEPIRKIISETKAINQIVYFGDNQIFEGATTYTCLFFFDKQSKKEFSFVNVNDLNKWRTQEIPDGLIDANSVTQANWNFSNSPTKVVFDKISSQGTKLGKLSKIFVGLQTSADPVYILKLISETKNSYKVFSKAVNKEFEIERHICKPLLKGSEIKRFDTPVPANVILFPYKETNNQLNLLSEKILSSNYPLAWKYLLSVKKQLQKRDNGKFDAQEWWQFGRSQNILEMFKAKILTQVLAKQASFTLDPKAEFCFVGGGNAGGYGLLINQEIKITEHYLIGLLNSNLLDSFLKSISTPFRGGFFSYAKRFIEDIPIIVPKTNVEKKIESEIIQNVELIISLKKNIYQENLESKISQIENRIEHSEEKINTLVYKLYNLSLEEIKLMEGGANE